MVGGEGHSSLCLLRCGFQGDISWCCIPLPSCCGPLQVTVAAAAVFPLFPAVCQALSQGLWPKVGLTPYGREKSPPPPPPVHMTCLEGEGKGGRVHA